MAAGRGFCRRGNPGSQKRRSLQTDNDERLPADLVASAPPIELDAAGPQIRHVLNDIVKDTPSLDLERFLGEVANAFDVEWSPAIEADYANGLILSWDQIRALSRRAARPSSKVRSARTRTGAWMRRVIRPSSSRS